MAAWRQSLSAFVLLNVLDMFTTWLGVTHGFTEASPLPSVLLSLLGPGAVFGLKAASMLGAAGIVLWFGRSMPGLWRALRLANFYLGLVVLFNSVQLLFA